MPSFSSWIADCHLQDRDASDDQTQDYICQVAVWADSHDTFRARLVAHLETTPYKLLWIEECLEALEYIKRHGQQARIGSLARTVHDSHRVELGTLTGKDLEDEPAEQLSFKEALLALDYKTAPVFAVLDGAQFDNLPKALFDGDFLSRPLYLDRGDNNPEQIITAPHMVTLDERSEKVTGRSYEDTLEALLELINDKPAAVFWQCPKGADALYKHLRSINMVLYPKAALDDWEEPEQETDDGSSLPAPDTHTMVLFRHADANVIAQTLFALNAKELSRFLGTSSLITLKPDNDWGKGHKYFKLSKPDNLPSAPRGFLRLSDETVVRMGDIRFERIKVRLAKYLRKVAPEQTEDIKDKNLSTFIEKSVEQAVGFGVETEAGFGRWCYLQLLTKGAMGKSPEVQDFMTVHDPAMSPDQRVRLLLRESSKQMEAVT